VGVPAEGGHRDQGGLEGSNRRLQQQPGALPLPRCTAARQRDPRPGLVGGVWGGGGGRLRGPLAANACVCESPRVTLTARAARGVAGHPALARRGHQCTTTRAFLISGLALAASHPRKLRSVARVARGAGPWQHSRGSYTHRLAGYVQWGRAELGTGNVARAGAPTAACGPAGVLGGTTLPCRRPQGPRAAALPPAVGARCPATAVRSPLPCTDRETVAASSRIALLAPAGAPAVCPFARGTPQAPPPATSQQRPPMGNTLSCVSDGGRLVLRAAEAGSVTELNQRLEDDVGEWPPCAQAPRRPTLAAAGNLLSCSPRSTVRAGASSSSNTPPRCVAAVWALPEPWSPTRRGGDAAPNPARPTARAPGDPPQACSSFAA
jgi:hypothetical protein